MRLRLAAPAAAVALALARLDAGAQLTSGPVLQRFTLSGCANGPIVRLPSGGTANGHIGCLFGTAELSLATNPSGFVFSRITGALTGAFSPDFPAPWVDFRPSFNEIRFTADPVSGGAPRVYFTGPFRPSPALVVGSPAPAFFDANGAFSSDPYRPETVRDVRGTMWLVYRIDGPPLSTLQEVPLMFTLTPVPEPSTFALAGVGGLALAGVGARRRRATGR
jgi:hypothetical protein